MDELPFYDSEYDAGLTFDFLHSKEAQLPLECSFFIAPFLPILTQVALRALDMADLTECDILADLGCGNGKLFEIVRDYKYNVKSLVGVELDTILYQYVVDRCIDGLLVINEDIFHVDLVKLNISCCILYLLEDGLVKLAVKVLHSWLLHNDLFRVITVGYPISIWTPVKTLSVPLHSPGSEFTGGADINSQMLFYYSKKSFPIF